MDWKCERGLETKGRRGGERRRRRRRRRDLVLVARSLEAALVLALLLALRGLLLKVVATKPESGLQGSRG